jgi:uncharacterized protein YlxW (UPF0749 family)
MTPRPHRTLGGVRSLLIRWRRPTSDAPAPDAQAPVEGAVEGDVDVASSEDATPSRTRRWWAWRIATPVVGLLSGVLFVVSAHSSEGTDLRPGRFTDLASMVRYDATRADALNQRAADLKEQVTLLSGSVDNRQVHKYNRKAALMKIPAGLLAASGPGVTVTLSDAPQSTGEEAPDTVDNPNLLLVHQQDIQAVVNAMWKGGAVAVTIQGQRVVSTTGIRCIGNSVQLQGVPYSQPYRISAVGDVSALTDAIANDAYLQVYRTDAANPDINIGWDEVVEDRVTAPGYTGLTDLQYARALPADGGS